MPVIVAGAAEPTNQWLGRGPEAGFVTRIEIDRVSSEPVAGGGSGLFRYDSGQAAWQYSNAGAPSPFVGDIVWTTPQGRPQSTFAISGGYVVRSDDGGQTWINTTNVLMAGQVVSLAGGTGANNITRIYAGVNPGNHAANGGIWISTDFGQTWTQSVQTSGSNVRLVRASLDPTLVFASGEPDANGVSGLYRSTDGGVTYSGPVAETAGTVAFPIVFVDVAHAYAPSQAMIALAAPDASAQTGGEGGGQLFRSSDDGLTWTATNDPFVIAPETVGSGEPLSLMYDWAHTDTQTVYVTTTWGVFKSVNGGAPQPASNGLLRLGVRGSGAQPYDTVYDITQFWDPNHTMYAATRSGGIYRSTDQAASWQPFNAGFTGLNFRMFAFQPGNTGVVLGGSADPSEIGGVYRSTDGGTTWQRSSTGLNANTVRGLAFAPAPNSNVVLAGGGQQQIIGGEFNKGVWRSTDSGQTWTALTDAGIRTSGGKRLIQFDPNDPNHVLLSSAGALHVSTDGGQTWVNSVGASASFGGLPTQVGGNTATLLGIAAGPGPVSGTRFYLAVDGGTFPSSPPAGAEGGVFYSDDGGFHWTRATGLPDDAASYFAVSPTAGTLYVTKITNGTGRQGGVFKSTDYGQTWQAATAGLPCFNIFTVAADPVDANVVWAACTYENATVPGGIFRSNDAAAHWVPYGRGLRTPSILWMTVDPVNTGHLLAGGYDGIYEMQFAPDGDQDGIPDSEEAQFASGDANNDGTPDATQSYVASVGTPVAAVAAASAKLATATPDYVVVEIDRDAPYTGTCQFVSDLQVVGTDQIPVSGLMQQKAPPVRFTLPNCSAAQVKIRYSAVAEYPVGVFGTYSPTTLGDGSTIRWGLLDLASISVTGDTWTLVLDENAYGNVYAPGSGSIQFQGAPGTDSIFGGNFEVQF